MAVTSIRNETPCRLTLVSIEDEELELAPLQQKAVGEDSGHDFEELEREGLVSQHREAPSDLGANLSAIIVGGGFWLVIICAILANKDEPLFDIELANWPWVVWGAGAAVLAVAAGIAIIRGTNSFSLVTRWTMQSIALTVILAIGVGLPAASIYYFGGGDQLLHHAQAGLGQSPSLALFGRLLQLSLISIASLLPVLLFFLFDRYQLGTLRRRLYISLFRLDPSLQTKGEVDAKYGSQIDEAFGPEDQGKGRLAAGSRWPVLVCSLVITLGWIMTLAPVGTNFDPETASEVIDSLLPQQSALVFGFLGAYFYCLRLIAFRYARGDLKPKAYSHIMVRIFIVAVLSWVLESISPDNTAGTTVSLLLAFLFGITPDEFFTWVKETFRDSIPGSAVPEIDLPLNKLEGIDLYDLGRLESEGIVNIEGLAHHEIMDLIIETRIPVPRLMDWLDQAMLYLHVVGGSDESARKKLRDYGIRTATDLEIAWSKAESRNDGSLDALKKLLGGEAPLYRLEVIRDALSDDEWHEVVKNWRREQSHPPIRRAAIPSSAEALQRRGEKDLAAQRYARAVSFFKQSIKVRDSAVVRRQLADVFMSAPLAELRDPEAAKRHADRAAELAPDDYDNTIDLLRIYINLADHDSAERMYTTSLNTVNGWPGSRSSDKKSETKRLEDFRAALDSLAQATA